MGKSVKRKKLDGGSGVSTELSCDGEQVFLVTIAYRLLFPIIDVAKRLDVNSDLLFILRKDELYYQAINASNVALVEGSLPFSACDRVFAGQPGDILIGLNMNALYKAAKAPKRRQVNDVLTLQVLRTKSRTQKAGAYETETPLITAIVYHGLETQYEWCSNVSCLDDKEVGDLVHFPPPTNEYPSWTVKTKQWLAVLKALEKEPTISINMVGDPQHVTLKGNNTPLVHRIPKLFETNEHGADTQDKCLVAPKYLKEFATIAATVSETINLEWQHDSPISCVVLLWASNPVLKTTTKAFKDLLILIADVHPIILNYVTPPNLTSHIKLYLAPKSA